MDVVKAIIRIHEVEEVSLNYPGNKVIKGDNKCGLFSVQVREE